MKPGAPMFCISTPSISTSWLKPGDPLMDFDHWLPVTPGVRNMKFSICLRPLAPCAILSVFWMNDNLGHTIPSHAPCRLGDGCNLALGSPIPRSLLCFDQR